MLEPAHVIREAIPLNDDRGTPPTYLIAIASYRRPEGLRRLLDSLQSAEALNSAAILVVDNDADGSARTAATTHPIGVSYVIESEPGIAAARNRALDEFSASYRAIIFIDDDEWVSPSWLINLTGYALQANADVVQGAVMSVFPDDAPPWVVRGGFVQRPVRKIGERLPSAATNNTLLTRDAWIRAGSPRFDPAFSVTGGSDADFFWGIGKTGAQIFFCPDAVVYEAVPTDRLSLCWLGKRAVRGGVVHSRVRMKHGDSMLVGLGKGALLAIVGMLTMAVQLASGRGLQAKAFNRFFNGYGRFAALFNYQTRDYARPSVPSRRGNAP